MNTTRVILLVFLASIVNLVTSGAPDFNVLHNLQLRQSSPGKAKTDGQLVALGEKLKQFNDKIAALTVSGDSDGMKEFFADDIIVLVFGKKPVFGAEEAAIKAARGFLAFFDRTFGDMARYELTLEDYGDIDGGMVWATGKGYGYVSDVADAPPVTSMTYERVWEHDENNNLRLAINAFIHHIL